MKNEAGYRKTQNMGPGLRRGDSLLAAPSSRSKLVGFSLLEMSIVLLIMATMVGMGVALFNASLSKSQFDITKSRMAAIQKALLDYRRAFHMIPCPTDVTLDVSNTNFGRGTIYRISGDKCDDELTPTIDLDPVWGGGVPVRVLGLPDEFAFDGWGRRFMYYVNHEVAGAYGFKDSDVNDTVGSISVVNASGGAIATALYVLLSHGENGHGAYTRKGDARVDADSTNTNELENCDCDDDAVTTTQDITFVQASPSVDTADATDVFDDILVYGTRASMRLLSE